MNDWRCDWKGYFYIREAKERFDLNRIYSKLYIAFLITTNQNFHIILEQEWKKYT